LVIEGNITLILQGLGKSINRNKRRAARRKLQIFQRGEAKIELKAN